MRIQYASITEYSGAAGHRQYSTGDSSGTELYGATS